VLDFTRRELALERLADGEPVAIVAERCGFANARNLVRRVPALDGPDTERLARARGEPSGLIRGSPWSCPGGGDAAHDAPTGIPPAGVTAILR
jgi:hypothetical protein